MVYRCKMCGGDLNIKEGLTTVKCEYCGNVNTIPVTKDDDLSKLFDRANELRRRCDFDLAERTYNKIIESGCDDAEAYWGLVLSRFGIEYVDDPATGKKIPTCHRAQYEAVSADYNYQQALERADVLQRPIYEEEARIIDSIQKEILAISQKEEPFDVFICYKETDFNGKRTPDSVIANDIYYQLTQEGYKVFYAAITLEDKLGQDYEPIIFAALNSAKVMLAIGTRPEYFKAVWVKNEWSRYLKIIKKDRTKRLFPCYKDMDPYELPEDFAHLQAQDMGKIGFINDIVRGIEKVIPRKSSLPTATAQNVITQTKATVDNSIAPLLKRAFLFLEDKQFNLADEYFEKVLDKEPENALAYLGKLMIDLKVTLRSKLGELSETFLGNNNYKKAYRFADPSLKSELDGYVEKIENRIKEKKLDEDYLAAVKYFANSITINDYETAKKKFSDLGNWKDSVAKAKLCFEKAQELKAKAEEKRKNDIYAKARDLLKSGDPNKINDAQPLLKSIIDYKDCSSLIDTIPDLINTAKTDNIYNEALSKLQKDNIDLVKAALNGFKTIPTWRDSEQKIQECLAKIEELEIKAQKEKEERERFEREKAIAKAKRQKAFKKALVISAIVSVVIIALVLTLTLYVIPTSKMKKADTLTNEGKYEEAAAIYGNISNFGSVSQKLMVIEAVSEVENINDGNYNESITKMLENGAKVTIDYSLDGGEFSDAPTVSVIYENGVAFAEENVTSYSYDSASSFKGLITPGRNGYNFVRWDLAGTSISFSAKTNDVKLKFIALWQTKQYSISYILDGGIFDSTATTAYDPEDDDIHLLTPSRIGYTFLGWSEGEGEPKLEYTIAKGSYGNKTFNAHWQANEYTISFDAKGGILENTTISVTYDQNYILPIPMRQGYDFIGWYNGKNKIADGVWNTVENINLTAKWTIIDYSITYVLDGGKNNSSNPKSYTIISNDIILKDAMRDGYTFEGWFLDEHYTESKKKITKGSVGQVTLYAKWSLVKYSISYQTGDVDNSPENPTEYYITSNDITLLDLDDLDYYTFDGWYVNEQYDKQITTITSGSFGNLELFAKWMPKEFAIIYNLDGGINSDLNPVSYNVESDEITLSEPSRNGYKFEGWFVNEQLTESITTIQTSEPKPITLFAKWSLVKYTITYYLNGGTNDDDNPTEYYVTTNDILLKAPTKRGYNFVGWYVDDDFKSAIEVINKGTYQNLSVYAKWDIITYKITYDLVGGTNNKNNLSSYTVESKDIVFENPFRIGYTFLNWTDDKKEPIEKIQSESIGDLTITANWQAKTYTVKFMPNGGEVDPNTKMATYDADFEAPIPSRIGYDFEYWTLNGVKYQNGKWTLDSEATMTAVWTARNDTRYKVNHYLQNADDDEYTLDKTDNLQGTSDSIVTLDRASYTGFIMPNSQKGTIAADGTAEYSYYYNRLTYTITYVANGGTCENSQTYKYEQTIATPTPTREEYTFGGWFTEPTLENENITVKMPLQTITLYAYWTEENKPTDFDYSISNNGVTIKAYIGSSETMNIPEYVNGIAVTEITESAFANNTVIQNAVLPTNVTSIPNRAFYQCVNLENVHLSEMTVTISNYAFAECINISKLNNTVAGKLSIPENVTSIGEYAFQSLGAVKEVVIPNSVNNIGNLSFKNCDSIESITAPFVGKTISSGTISSVYTTTILKTVTITIQTEIPNDAFSNITTLEIVTIPAETTIIGSSAFYGCVSLKKLNCEVEGIFNLPSTITEIQSYAFYNCESLENIEIPHIVSVIGSSAFEGCISLIECVMPDDSNIDIIASSLFKGCISLTTINIPDVSTISDYAFSGCRSITKINSAVEGELIIPDSVQTIGVYAFDNLELITKIIVPEGVISIGAGSFKGCNALQEITLPFVGINEQSTIVGNKDHVFGIIFGYEIQYNSNRIEFNNYALAQGTFYPYRHDGYSSDIGFPANTVGQCSYYYFKQGQFGGTSVKSTAYLGYYIPTTLKKVTITKGTAIHAGAFYNCDFIEEITLPIDTLNIGENAFVNCNATVNYNYISSTSAKWYGDIADSFHGGDGTEDDPYQIYKASELAYLTSIVNGGNNCEGVFFKLTANIDLGNEKWTPIGTKINQFKGSFDGNGKSIIRLNVNGSDMYSGLFGYSSGYIHNVGIINSSITVNSTSGIIYVGSLVGYLTGRIQNCYSTVPTNATANSTAYGGGLVGYVDTTGIVCNSYASGAVTVTSNSGFSYAGGLVGYNKGTLQGSIAYGNVTSKGSGDNYCKNGGLVGDNQGTITDCFRSADQIILKNTTESANNDFGTVADEETLATYREENW